MISEILEWKRTNQTRETQRHNGLTSLTTAMHEQGVTISLQSRDNDQQKSFSWKTVGSEEILQKRTKGPNPGTENKGN